jgi:hypothetical protein
MEDRRAQGLPEPLPVNAAGVEKPPDVAGGYDQPERIEDAVDTLLLGGDPFAS